MCISSELYKNSTKMIVIVLLILLAVLDCHRTECRTIESEEDVSIPEAVIQCRNACYERFLLQMENIVELERCQSHNTCAMCYDFCGILYVDDRSIFKSICKDFTCVSVSFVSLFLF